MDAAIWSMTLSGGADVALVRQHMRLIADRLGFDDPAGIALATAVGVVARNAVDRGGGRADVSLRGDAGRPGLEIAIIDDRPGRGPMPGLGGARQLVDHAAIETAAAGRARVRLVKLLPERAPEIDALALAAITTALETAAPLGLAAALEQQDRALAAGLDALQAAHDRTSERLTRVNALAARLLDTMGREFRTPLNSIRALARMLLDGADGDLTAEQEKQVGFMLMAAESVSDQVDDLLELGRIDAGEPVAARPWRARRDEVSPPPADGPAPVLIIEERPEDLRLYEGFLRGSGYRIAGARSLAEAGQVIAETVPCAVVLDVAPGDDAVRRFLAGLKQDARTRAVPVLAATTPDDAPIAGWTGVDRVVVKPIERELLLAALAQLVPSAGAGPQKILIIDDDEAWRFALRQFIPAGVGVVREAADGEDGLRQLLAEPPDVAFVDLVMPGLSGFDVIRAAAADDRTSGVPIVVVTSCLLNAAERASLSSAVAILRKDAMSKGSVAAALDQALGRHPSPG